MSKIYYYTSQSGKENVGEFIDTLSKNNKIKLFRIKEVNWNQVTGNKTSWQK